MQPAHTHATFPFLRLRPPSAALLLLIEPGYINTMWILYLSTFQYVEFVQYEDSSYLLVLNMKELIYESNKNILGAKMSGEPDPCGAF